MSNVYVQGPAPVHRISYGPHAKLGNARIVEAEGGGKGYSGHIRLLVILVLFLALLTIASIILSVVSITSWGKKDGKGEYDHYRDYYYRHYGKDDKDDKTPYHPYPPYPYPPKENYGSSPVVITNSVSDVAAKKKDCYTISFSEDWYQHEYIDENDKCALKGWGPAIALAACEAAGIKCKIIYTPWQQCIDYFTKDDWNKHPVLGDGLYYHAIDACGGWFPDQERWNVAAFTYGWIRNPKVFLWYLSSSGAPSGTIRIGFAYAAPWNEKCLKRYLAERNYNYDALVSFSGEGAVYDALQAGNIELAFLSDLTVAPGGFTGLTRLFPEYPTKCAEGEAGLVTRKCEWEFIQKFNKGLKIVKHNGVVRDFCNSVTISSPDQNGNWCPVTVWA